MFFRRLLAAGAAGVCTGALWVSGVALAASSSRDQIRFGAEMARAGNWGEAIFRWKKALEAEPDNARLYNNLAVAYETRGEWALAESAYKKALVLNPGLQEVRENFALFQSFYEQVRRRKLGAAAQQDQPPPAAPAQPPAAPSGSHEGGR